MPNAYSSRRGHLDDIIELGEATFRRRQAALNPSRETQSLAELDVAIVGLAERIEARLELTAARGEEVPLLRLRTAFQLEATEERCLWLLLALAVSEQVRDLAGVVDEVPLALLDDVVYGAASVRDRFARELGPAGRLSRYGLLETKRRHSQDGLRGRSVQLAERIIDLGYGLDGLSRDVASFATLVEPSDQDLLIDPEICNAVRTALETHSEMGDGPVPVLRGVEGSGRRSLVAAAALALRARVLVVRCGELPDAVEGLLVAVQREAILHRAVIVLSDLESLVADPSSGRPDRIRPLDAMFRNYSGPLALTADKAFSQAALPSRGTIALEIVALSEAERATLWSRVLADTPEHVIREAAARYRLSGGQIERAARIVRGRTSRETLALADIHLGVRGALADQLAGLGVRIEWRQTWSDLVLPEDSLGELHEIIGRVRHKRQVLDEWGFADKVAKGLGVAVLFTGPPGTGKTMAAGLIAHELGLDLYQIDLSRMVSKYVGETEKNLAQVFDAAETGHAILLFDEADALFAKRTEVKSSVDRYANLEVNYLLQRMESFAGITILTPNFDSAIDEAFRRRLPFRIAFPLPEVEERARLWQAVIPARALGTDVDFTELAARFAMSGGYIKNAALRAAYLAAEDKTEISMRHLIRAAAAEYSSMGKVTMSGSPHGLA